MSYEDRRGKVDHDTPPFSRLFVVCSKNHDDADIKEAFGNHGTLEDVWVVKDKSTHESKGICYIKFKKASEAHLAMEELHGAIIGNDSKPLKVLLADSKGQSRSASSGDTKPRSRIFILVAKGAKNSELEEEFSKYGAVEGVQILTDKATGESKRCAYVKFEKPSAAFIALESCDEMYKAVIAEPRVPRDMVRPGDREPRRGRDSRDSYGSRSDFNWRPPSGYSSEQAPANLETISFTDMTDPGAMQRLYIVCHTSLYEEQLFSLFDLIPGLEHFELKMYRGTSESRGFAYAQYRTLELACYAKRKLDGIEYPPGHRLIVKYADLKPSTGKEGRDSLPLQQPMDYNPSSRGRQHSDTWNSSISTTTSVPNRITYSSIPTGPAYPSQQSQQSQPHGNSATCVYTDVSLPAPQQMAAPNTPCRAKLFIVSTPTSPDETALLDVFSRFASLIDIKLLPGTSYGYIRYGMMESAEAAKMIMNSATISGSTIRLSQCDDTADNNPKRSRQSFDGYQGQF